MVIFLFKMNCDKIYAGSKKHSRGNRPNVQYGTAGFRDKAETLDYVVYRMGLLASLRSCSKKAAIGVMITASHNPIEDNGVKLIDPLGEMLDMRWESLATRLVSVQDDQVTQVLQEIVAEKNISFDQQPIVFVGQDTRPSSEFLSSAVVDGVRAFSGEIRDCGLVSTPQLHYLVACFNTAGSYGQPSEEGYYTKLATAFKKLRKGASKKGNYNSTVLFDGANGVGALKMKDLLSYLDGTLDVSIFNSGAGTLNYQCGAEFVKACQKAPHGVPVTPETRCLSVDGDADRIIYYYIDSHDTFHLLDGDKIATLVAGHLKSLIEKSGLSLNLGLVQTAYSNGASADYISNKLHVPLACVCTGVKYLHHKALDYDIGVYFEANGHGTVVFSEKARHSIRETFENQSLSQTQREAAVELHELLNVINETVGDALSDMLLVESVLYSKGWSIVDWNQAYTDLPNRLVKVKVKDRNAVTTTDAERRCVTPGGLQEAIDETVKQFKKARAFVRPSGTEDVVRVYSEADTQTNADALATQVVDLVKKMAGGV